MPIIPAGGGLVQIDDHGTSQGSVNEIDFEGSGVTASVLGTVATITVSGGAGASWSAVQVDFGTKPVFDANFVITDALSRSGSIIPVLEFGRTATGRVDGDAQWDSISFAAKPANGSFTVYAMAHPGPVVGKRYLIYTVA